MKPLQESKMLPMPMAELLPGLTGIMSKEAIRSLTAKKSPGRNLALSQTNKEIIKPLTIAELNAELSAYRRSCSRKIAQPCTSTKKNNWNSSSKNKKNWNSSTKVEKKINRTTNGIMKHNTVRKVLTFPENPRPPTVSMPTVNPETPRFPKPQLKVKKPSYALMQPQKIKSTVRISGVSSITETPREKTILNRNRIAQASKENLPTETNVNRKCVAPPMPVCHKKIITNTMPDTPMFNDSCISNSDDSFLQKEKEFCSIEEKVGIGKLANEHTLERISKVSPPASTPFKEYRSVEEYFNDSSAIKNTTYYDDDTMCFHKTSTQNKYTNEVDRSAMSQLCDLFDKVNMLNTEDNTETNDLTQEQQIEHSVKMLDGVIQRLIKIKETQLKLLEQTRNKSNKKKESQNTILVENNDLDNVILELNPENKQMHVKRPSDINSSSKLSYKIPKKTTCLRKKLAYTSMPNTSGNIDTSDLLNNDKALDMYMTLKKQMNFLNTPVAKRAKDSRPPDTPAITSHNLQMQLDKLYNEK